MPGTAETLQPLSSGFRAVNIDAGRRVDFDTAEKCGEQEKDKCDWDSERRFTSVAGNETSINTPNGLHTTHCTTIREEAWSA